MVRQQNTKVMNRRKPAVSRPPMPAQPVIESIDPVAGQANRLEITFSAPVIIDELPLWAAKVGANWIDPVSISSQTQTTLVLDYGVSVATATEMRIPAGDQSALSYQAQRVPEGIYPLAA
jgi:hypothetical protein